MFDVVLAKSKNKYKVLVFKDDFIKRKLYFTTYAQALKRARRMRKPILDAVRNRGIHKKRRKKR